MGLISIPDSKHFFVAGQFSAYDTSFSAPFSGIAVLHPKAGRIDLFITCAVESVSSLPAVYDYFNLDIVCSQVGIKSISFDASTTSVVVSSTQPLNNLVGRTGVKILLSNKNRACLGRSYTPDLAVVGGWAAQEMIHIFDQYTISIIGATVET